MDCHYEFFYHCEERSNLSSQSHDASAIPTTAAERKHIHVTAKKGRSAVNALRALCLALYTVIARNEAIQALNLKGLRRFPLVLRIDGTRSFRILTIRALPVLP